MNSNDTCSANPMTLMLKQLGRDQSLQQDRFKTSPQPFVGPSTMRTPSFVQPEESTRNFFFAQEQQYQQTNNGIHVGNSFEFSELQNELDKVHHMDQPQNWAKEFDAGYQNGPYLRKLSPGEKAVMERVFMESRTATGSSQNTSVWKKEFVNHPGITSMSPDQSVEFEAAFQKHFNWATEFNLQAKNNGLIQLNNNATWEEQFSIFDDIGIIKEATTTSAEETTTKEAVAENLGVNDDENVWQSIRNQLAETNNWGDEFGTFSDPGIIQKPELGEYVFEASNPFLMHPDPISEGLRLLDEGCSLTDVALAFEAAVQKNPNDSQAWMHLGNAQAQNEKDIPAIRALERAIVINPGNLDALMSLSVSYTNECYDLAAYQTLECWITKKYPNILNGQVLSEKVSPFERHERVTNLFLAVARQTPDGQAMDPDVQIGLGVLFYGNGDLDKAVDCFITALKVRPHDYLLWNRMGATLANNGYPEEAIDAYHKALEIRPSFVRARYNIGVSCINIGCYKEAAEHILTGLSMHKRSIANANEDVNVSSNSWEMLRKAFIMMGRRDLADNANAGTDLNQFRPEFEF